MPRWALGSSALVSPAPGPVAHGGGAALGGGGQACAARKDQWESDKMFVEQS